MILDLTSMRKAVASLDSAMKIWNSESTGKLDSATRAVIRAGVIQNFEFTYEQSHKMLKRFLATNAPNPETIEEMSFSDLIRTGSEQGLLLKGWDEWKGYRKARGTTSHTYDEEKAMDVLAVVPSFQAEVMHLLSELERRNRDSD